MDIKVEKNKNVTILELNGRLDVKTSADLEKVFNEIFPDKPSKVLVDCRQLAYISSAGLRVLLAAAKKFKPSEISLSGLSQNVKQVFELSGFTSIFTIYSSREEALGAM